VLETCYRAVIENVGQYVDSARHALFIGGKSMGGRIATQVAAADADLPLAGLVLLGYPLHPPGRPDKLRDAHLPAVGRSTLFVQGSRDGFGTPDELQPIFARMIPTPTMYEVIGGDHSFKVTGRDPMKQRSVYEDAQREIVRWMALIAPSRADCSVMRNSSTDAAADQVFLDDALEHRRIRQSEQQDDGDDHGLPVPRKEAVILPFVNKVGIGSSVPDRARGRGLLGRAGIQRAGYWLIRTFEFLAHCCVVLAGGYLGGLVASPICEMFSRPRTSRTFIMVWYCVWLSPRTTTGNSGVLAFSAPSWLSSAASVTGAALSFTLPWLSMVMACIFGPSSFDGLPAFGRLTFTPCTPAVVIMMRSKQHKIQIYPSG